MKKKPRVNKPRDLALGYRSTICLNSQAELVQLYFNHDYPEGLWNANEVRRVVKWLNQYLKWYDSRNGS